MSVFCFRIALKFISSKTGKSFTSSKNYVKLSSKNLYYSTVNMSSFKIGTHNGTFHCDEVLACSLLKLLPQYKDATIVRSRDQQILDTCDIVVDVGGKYDPETHRYDHHMREFSETFKSVMKKPGYDSEIKLSSAGLIYCHFGKKIINQLVPELNDDDSEKIFKKIYETLIIEIDGIDNGVQMFDGEPRYQITTNLSARVGRLNPQWNTPELVEEEQFNKAMSLVREEFVSYVESSSRSWLPARNIIKEAIERRFEVDPSGEIVEFTQAVPWKEHLFDLEEELNVNPSIKFIIYKNNTYRVQGVPEKLGCFSCRISLPEEWAGLADDHLSKVSKIEDCVFVHSARFIGGNKNRDGTLTMARTALKKFYESRESNSTSVAVES